MNRRSSMLGVAGALAAPALPAAPIANRELMVDGVISAPCFIPDSFGNLTIRTARISDMKVGTFYITREGMRIVGT